MVHRRPPLMQPARQAGCIATLRSRSLPALALAVAIVASGCGGEGGDRPRAQPAPGAADFRGGGFDGVPRYPRSEELGAAVETNEVVTQTFSVPNAAPREIVEHYEALFHGAWVMVEPVREVGDQAFRARWVDGEEDRLLQVTASPAPTIDDPAPAPGGVIVQYSLQLGPRHAFP